jgi:hypothetical protein
MKFTLARIHELYPILICMCFQDFWTSRSIELTVEGFFSIDISSGILYNFRPGAAAKMQLWKIDQIAQV